MGKLQKFLGKLLSGDAPAPAPASAETPPVSPQGGSEPPHSDPALAECQRAADDQKRASEHPEQALSPITEIKYISAGEAQEGGAQDGSGQDRLVMVYEGQDLVFEVTEDMKRLSATDFVPRLIDQAYQKYEILFDTDDIFQVMMLLRKARPAEQT